MRQVRVVGGVGACWILLLVACGASSGSGGAGSGGGNGNGAGNGSEEAGAGAGGLATGTGGAEGSGGGRGIILATGGATVVSGTGGEATRAHVPMACENPQENPYGGGFLICDRNLMHRPSTSRCQSPLPRAEPAEPLVGDECVYDADCTGGANAYCLYGLCVYGGCLSDADCGEGGVCFCQELVGICVGASCHIDAECPADSHCAGEFQGVARPGGFACQKPDDQCDVSSECPARSRCVPSPRTCVNDIVG